MSTFSFFFFFPYINLYNFNKSNLIYIFSAAASSLSALKQPTIRVVAIIAEGVPESDTKELIAYARANNKVMIQMEVDQL